MICPKPPRVRPAPAESGRSSLRQNTTGATFSVASTGMVRTPDGNAVPSSPSNVRRAPVPPELNVITSKSGSTGRLPRAWPDTADPPRNGGFQRHEDPSAATRSGTIWCRHPIIRSGSNCPTTCRTDTGYGRGAFRMQPSGIFIRNGSRLAQLFGISGATTTLIPKQEYARQYGAGTLIPRDDRPDVPAKSTSIASDRMVIAACSVTGSSYPSDLISEENVPAGSRAICSRVARRELSKMKAASGSMLSIPNSSIICTSRLAPASLQAHSE